MDKEIRHGSYLELCEKIMLPGITELCGVNTNEKYEKGCLME